MIELREIDRNNFHAVLRLRVAESQRAFVADNAYSLAQAKACPECVPLAAYEEGALVGFVMYCMDPDDDEYWIVRLMVDEGQQRKGYGRQIMRETLARIMADRTRHKVYISFEPDNAAARTLYEALGFMPDGRVIEGEIVYWLAY